MVNKRYGKAEVSSSLPETNPQVTVAVPEPPVQLPDIAAPETPVQLPDIASPVAPVATVVAIPAPKEEKDVEEDYASPPSRSKENAITPAALTEATVPLTVNQKDVMSTPEVQRDAPARAPPPVQALRIVKRAAKRGAPAAVINTPLSSAPDIGSVVGAPKKPARTTASRPTRPADAPAPAAQEIRAARVRAPTVNNTNLKAAAIVSKAAPPPPKLGAPITTGDGPRRVLVTDPSAPVQPKSMSVAKTQNRIAGLGAAKPPVRPTFPSSKTTGSESALPRPTAANNRNPTSRLPAPVSGISRLRAGNTSGSGNGVVAGRSLPRRGLNQ